MKQQLQLVHGLVLQQQLQLVHDLVLQQHLKLVHALVLLLQPQQQQPQQQHQPQQQPQLQHQPQQQPCPSAGPCLSVASGPCQVVQIKVDASQWQVGQATVQVIAFNDHCQGCGQVAKARNTGQSKDYSRT